MTDPTTAAAAASPRASWRDHAMLALACVAPAVVVAGVVRNDGDRGRQMMEIERRVTAVERKFDTIEDMNRRLARIEGKLDGAPITRERQP